MALNIPISPGITLNFGDQTTDQNYPTARLQKGFILIDQGMELTEEAVGFGVPVVRRGLQSIFPGAAELSWKKTNSTWVVTARFRLNLVEKISRGGDGNVGNKWFYAVKDFLAAAIIRHPAFRGILTSTSSAMRRLFNLKTIYADGGESSEVSVVHTIEAGTGRIRVDVDLSRLPSGLTEVVMMNEQGAHTFDRYRDSSGEFLQGSQVGCWDEVHADQAWFESSTRRIAFKLNQVQGARLFRGRELIGSRLAWAGFGYSFPASLGNLHYELNIERLA